MIILILKIIGIILLLVLAVLFVLIFIPFCFKAELSCHDKTYRAKGKLRSGLGFFLMKFSYEKEAVFGIYIFWGLIRILGGKKKEKKDKSAKEDKRVEAKDSPDSAGSLEEGNQSEPDKDSATIKEGKNKEAKEKKREKNKEKKSFFEKIKKFFEIIKEVKDKRIIKRILEMIKEFLGHIKISLSGTHMEYSLGDPEYTGLLTGALSCMSICYRDNVKVIPDFASDEMYVNGQIRIKGSIMLLWLLILVIKLFTYKDARKIFDEIGG